MHENVKRNWRLMLLLPALLLSACATPSRVSSESCPNPPPKPNATQQAPRLPYSASARIAISEWQKRLMDTLQTQPSVSQPGPSN